MIPKSHSHSLMPYTRRSVCKFGLVLLMGAAVTVAASAHEPASHHGGHGTTHRPWPGSIGLGMPYYPEIGIDIRPKLEHWPSNYWPDGYRLPGYDGKPAGNHFCRGPHGRTLSSSGTDCPPDEHPDESGRHLSTDGF